MLSLDLETDTTAEDTAPSTPDGGAETPASLDVLEEVWDKSYDCYCYYT